MECINCEEVNSFSDMGEEETCCACDWPMQVTIPHGYRRAYPGEPRTDDDMAMYVNKNEWKKCGKYNGSVCMMRITLYLAEPECDDLPEDVG